MNREEILNMPAGREMDALVWKVLNDRNLDSGILDCRLVDGDVQPHAGYPIGHVSPLHYSTDIAAAWKVVEKLSELNNGDISIVLYQRASYSPQWRCNLAWKKIFLIATWEDTAPLAICRAALTIALEE